MKTTLKSIVIAVLAIAFFSCTKDDHSAEFPRNNIVTSTNSIKSIKVQITKENRDSIFNVGNKTGKQMNSLRYKGNPVDFSVQTAFGFEEVIIDTILIDTLVTMAIDTILNDTTVTIDIQRDTVTSILHRPTPIPLNLQYGGSQGIIANAIDIDTTTFRFRIASATNPDMIFYLYEKDAQGTPISVNQIDKDSTYIVDDLLTDAIVFYPYDQSKDVRYFTIIVQSAVLGVQTFEVEIIGPDDSIALLTSDVVVYDLADINDPNHPDNPNNYPETPTN